MSKYINIGCGWRNFGKRQKVTTEEGNKDIIYWDHVDGGDYEHLDSKDVFLNDYEDESVDLIYCSHMLEYFDREEVKNLLFAWHKKLKKGGKIYLSVPDFEAMSKLYTLDRIPLHKFLGPIFGKMKMGEETVYHKTVYDYSSLGELLRFKGFGRIDKWEHEELNWWLPEWDDHSLAKVNDILISLNICCEKL